MIRKKNENNVFILRCTKFTFVLFCVYFDLASCFSFHNKYFLKYNKLHTNNNSLFGLKNSTYTYVYSGKKKCINKIKVKHVGA